jgi:WD repeat-containing protein 35
VCRYSLPHLALEAKLQLRCRPARLALNCSGSRMAVLDVANVLTLRDFGAVAVQGGPARHMAGQGQHVEGWERRDVWDVRWSEDDPELLVCCEKSKMTVVRWAPWRAATQALC